MDPHGPIEVRLARATPHGDGEALHDLRGVGADLSFFLLKFFFR